MKIHHLTIAEAFASLKSDVSGANVFLCRSERETLFAGGLFRNKLILAGIATEIVLLAFIDYTPWGQMLFGTAPIPAAVWLFILPFALGMLALEELRKWFVRSHGDRRSTGIVGEKGVV